MNRTKKSDPDKPLLDSLNPCACGGITFEFARKRQGIYYLYSVRCMKCGEKTEYAPNRGMAMAAWNKRKRG